jgi:hypothetical protein
VLATSMAMSGAKPTQMNRAAVATVPARRDGKNSTA